jgi:hypothetical protein
MVPDASSISNFGGGDCVGVVASATVTRRTGDSSLCTIADTLNMSAKVKISNIRIAMEQTFILMIICLLAIQSYHILTVAKSHRNRFDIILKRWSSLMACPFLGSADSSRN